MTARERFGPLLKQRVLNSKRNKAELRASLAPESWVYTSGSYHTSILDSDPLHGFSHLELTGIERGIFERVVRLLSVERDRPVIFLDIGSGLSTSLIKIGAQLESIGKHMSDGRVILIGSNLSDTFPNLMDTYYQTLNVPHHIHSVVADIAELSKVVLTNAHGESLRLVESCDIIHESKALMHSHIPDADLRLLPKLLAPRGVLLLRSVEQEIHPSEQQSSRAYVQARLTAHERGMAALGREGSLFAILPPHLLGNGSKHSEYGIYQKLSSAHEDEDVSYEDFR